MSIRFGKYLLSIFVLAIIIGEGYKVDAQANSHWKKIGQLIAPPNGQYRTAVFGYFWSPARGLVFTHAGLSDSTRVAYTSDSGKTWTLTSGLDTFSNMTGLKIGGRILMVNDSIGWLVWGRGSTWKTLDGGKTWSKIGSIGNDLYSDLNGQIHTLYDYYGGGRVPGGTTIVKLSDSIWITSNAAILPDSLDEFNFMQSTNGGETWRVSTPFALDNPRIYRESWGIYASPQWHEIIGAPEIPGTFGSIYSMDSGLTWNRGGGWPTNAWTSGGDVEGGRNAVYAQGLGLMRTTDSGKTWSNVGGPANTYDTRFCVIDCLGAEVVAFDDDGGIWLTIDGGDGSLTPENAHPKFSSNPIVSTATLCSDTEGGFRIYNDHCDSIIVLSIQVIDSTSIAVTSGAFGFDSLPILPLMMNTGKEDSISFHWLPSGRFTLDTTINIRVDVHYFSQTLHSEADTIITLKLVAASVPINYSVSAPEIALGEVSTCSPQDTTLTINNTGCVPILLDSLMLSGSSYSVISSRPTSIPTGDSITLGIRFSPTNNSSQFGKLTIFMNEQGKHFSQIVEFNGQGVQGEGILTIDSISMNAGSFSFCAGDTSVASIISNIGCDTLVITNVRFSGDGTFTLTSQPSDSLLAPNSLGMFTFNFTPRLKGAHSAQVTFHTRNLHGGDPGHDTTITINGIGLNGTTTLAVDQSLRNLGQIYVCQSKDTTITLYNPGCDTLTVNSDSIYNSAYSSSSTYPIVIPPGDSSVVQVSLKPSDSVLNGTITFTSNANSGSSSATVPLTANLLYPATLRLVLAPSDSAFAGQIVTAYMIIDGSIPFDQISALHFDITHNDDLLSYVSYIGPGLTIDKTLPAAGIVTQSFTLTPVVGKKTISDTIGILTFQVYLSDSSLTELSLSNISFSTPLSDMPPDCIASIGDSGAAFAYLYRCGNDIIQDAMEGDLAFTIVSIQPNPASSSIEINLSKSSSLPIDYTLFDALGQTVLSQHSVLTTQHLDVSSLPSGTYFIRLSQNGFVQSRRIIIER